MEFMSASDLALDRCHTRIDQLATARVSLAEYAATVVPALRRAVGFDGWCLELSDPDSSLPVAVALGDPPLGDRLPQFWQFEFGPPGAGISARRPVVAAASRHDPAGTRRFAELLTPAGVGDELRGLLATDPIRWGSLALFRSEGGPPFTEVDTSALARVLRPLAAGARHAWITSAPRGADRGMAEPGTLLYGRAGALVSKTPAARRWLAQLDGGYSMILAMLAMLDTAPAASLRTRTAAGTWLRMSGGWLVPPVGAAVIAITIQPASPAELTPLLLRAYGLTLRQRTVARLVLAGQSSQQIAAALHVSHHTVNDHVRAITDKTGVRSRAQLAAVLTGSPEMAGYGR